MATKNNEFIKTSDGRIAFKKSNFLRLKSGEAGYINKCYEIVIYTSFLIAEQRTVYSYDNKPSWQKSLKEISEQL